MDEEVVNYYKQIPKKYLTKYHNPHFEDHGIKVPFRMLIVGASGSMKPNCARTIIGKMANTFGNIKIICRNKDEPIYQDLMRKIPHEQLQITEGMTNFPDLDNPNDFHPQLQHLVIFDDLAFYPYFFFIFFWFGHSSSISSSENPSSIFSHSR